MLKALGKIRLAVALDALGLALLVASAFTFILGFAAAGVACLLLSWRYGE